MEALRVYTLAEMTASGETPEILFWVGCAGSFDERIQRVTRALAQILTHVGIKFAILGTEESCTGDPARRAGNEFLFQLQALGNISVLNGYSVKKIVTACPHCFNTIRNEYPELGGNYDIQHHTELIAQLIKEGRLLSSSGAFAGKKITIHDSCYLGRGNGIYEAPREVLAALDVDLVEMKRSRAKGLCCGAGGAQMFKEPEPGRIDINIERTEEALSLRPQVIAVSCPFCMTMMRDGVKHFGKESETEVLDLAELTARANGLKPV